MTGHFSTFETIRTEIADSATKHKEASQAMTVHVSTLEKIKADLAVSVEGQKTATDAAAGHVSTLETIKTELANSATTHKEATEETAGHASPIGKLEADLAIFVTSSKESIATQAGGHLGPDQAQREQAARDGEDDMARARAEYEAKVQSLVTAGEAMLASRNKELQSVEDKLGALVQSVDAMANDIAIVKRTVGTDREQNDTLSVVFLLTVMAKVVTDLTVLPSVGIDRKACAQLLHTITRVMLDKNARARMAQFGDGADRDKVYCLFHVVGEAGRPEPGKCACKAKAKCMKIIRHSDGTTTIRPKPSPTVEESV